jgi:RNA-directed DNA polymerase
VKKYKNVFDKVIELDNIFSAWDEFKKGKCLRPDVGRFELDLETELFKLHDDLKNEAYLHGPYMGFFISDPKRRHIHKATVRDRVVHHAVFNILNPIFEKAFIANSFSCRIGKGSHRGVETLAGMLRKVSQNNSRPCYVLKCDVQKFFDSIDHQILLSFLSEKIRDVKMIRLLNELVGSYENGKSEIREREREREREY